MRMSVAFYVWDALYGLILSFDFPTFLISHDRLREEESTQDVYKINEMQMLRF